MLSYKHLNWLSLRTPNVVSSLFVLHSSLSKLRFDESLPFIPLLLIPVMTGHLVQTQGLRRFYRIIKAVRRCWRNHLIIITETVPARNGDATGEVDAIIIACTFESCFFQIRKFLLFPCSPLCLVFLIEVVRPATCNSVNLSFIITHGIMNRSQESDSLIESCHSDGKESTL